MKPWIYICITTEKLNFAKMSVTTLLHSHDDLYGYARVVKMHDNVWYMANNRSYYYDKPLQMGLNLAPK